MSSKRYRWWHGLLFYAGVQVGRLALRSLARNLAGNSESDSREQDRAFYRAQRLPAFAPPAIAFPIAWTVNGACAVAGGLHVLNLPSRTPGRSDFLRFQAAAWTLFAGFDAAYFALRSPLNAAAVTILYTSFTVASLDTALRRMRDREAALSLATTLAWLCLANPLAVTQAARNHDPFWNVGPWLAPRTRVPQLQ